MTKEENYKVQERSIAIVEKHGTVEKALSFLKADMNQMHDLWGMYSSDCLGHGITCTGLMIDFLENKQYAVY